MSAMMEWVTFGIAVLGAVLSIVNFIIDLKRHCPRLKVFFRRGQKTECGTIFEVRYIEVVNVGEVPVTVTQFGVRVRRKKDFITLEAEYSDGGRGDRKLEPGDKCTVNLACDDCAKPEMDHPLRAIVLTATHEEFASEIINENLNLVAEKMGW